MLGTLVGLPFVSLAPTLSGRSTCNLKFVPNSIHKDAQTALEDEFSDEGSRMVVSLRASYLIMLLLSHANPMIGHGRRPQGHLGIAY